MQEYHRQLHGTFAVRAYFHWINEGRPEGRDRVHWYRAINEVDPTFPPEDVPEDLLRELPEVRIKLALSRMEDASMDEARRVDALEMYGEPLEGELQGKGELIRFVDRSQITGPVLVFPPPSEVRAKVDRLFGQRDAAMLYRDSESAAAIDRQIENLSEQLKQCLPPPKQDNEPLRPLTVGEFVTVRKAMGMSRSDVIEDVFTLWNETPDEDLHRQIDEVWPWEAAPLETQIADIDQLHKEGSLKSEARMVFMMRHAHPHDKDKRDYARERFEISWKNAVRRKSKAKRD